MRDAHPCVEGFLIGRAQGRVGAIGLRCSVERRSGRGETGGAGQRVVLDHLLHPGEGGGGGQKECGGQQAAHQRLSR